MPQLAGVAAVLLLLGAAVWWLRRAGFAARVGSTAGGNRRILEKIGRLPLGPHHTLQLVRLADRVLVLAVHTSGCSLVETLNWREIAPPEEAGTVEGRR